MKLEEMERKLSVEIGCVKAMMVHRFCEVDQKLIAIEHLLKKVIEKEQDIGMASETGNLVNAEKSMLQTDGEVQETNDEIMQGPKRRMLFENGRWQGPPWKLRVGSGQDEQRWPKYGPDFGIERDYCMPDWVCNRVHGFQKENGPCVGFDYGSHEGFGLKVVKADGLGGKISEKEPGIVKAGQDEIAKDSLISDGLETECSRGKLAVETAGLGGKKSEKEPTDGLGTEGSSGALGKVAEDTETLQSEMKPKSGVVESNNKAATEKSKKPVFLKQKKRKMKRKRRVGGSNDVPRVITRVTETGQQLDMFTSDEHEILTDIDPIMYSINKIMHQNGYKDGDRLSVEDQTYILGNIFNHHPERAQKMGDGVDYMMVMRNEENPCFYIVLNGRKEEISYRECLENFIRKKYPDKVDTFIPKYFIEPNPYLPRKRDRSSDPDEVKSPVFPSGFNLKLNVVTDKSGVARVPMPVFGQKKDFTSEWNVTGGVLFQKKNLSLKVADGGTQKVDGTPFQKLESKNLSLIKEGDDGSHDGFGLKMVKADESVGFGGKKSEKEPGIVKTGQDEIAKDSLIADGLETEGSNGLWGKKKDDKNVLLKDSWRSELAVRLDSVAFDKQPKATKRPKRKGHNFPVGKLSDDLRPISQMTVESDKGDYKHEAQVEGSNEKGHDESEKPVSDVLEGSPKRKCIDWARSSGPLFTVTKQWLDMFTSNEQQILTDIEPIMQSIQKIMYHNGYNDGDPLSADDQTYILNNVFNHHPEKARKMGTGVDYIMVTKNIKFHEDRCFYAVSDGCKEEVSYRECLENFVREKYPDKAEEFIPKYFKEPRPSLTRDRDSCTDEAVIPFFQSGSGLEFSNFSEDIFKSVS